MPGIKNYHEDERAQSQAFQGKSASPHPDNLAAHLEEAFSPSEPLLESEQDADQAIRDVHFKIQEMKARLKLETSLIIQSAQAHVLPAAETARWWEVDNVLTLSCSQIRQASHLQGPNDAVGFMDYLYPLMDSYLAHQATNYDEPSADFMDKIDLLRNLLRRSTDLAMESEYIRFNMYLLLSAMPQRHFNTWSPRMVSKFEELRSHLCICLSDDSAIKLGGAKKDQQSYLNAVSAFQELMRSYDSHECDFKELEIQHQRPNCFHKRHDPLLNDLVVRGHQEVRENAFIAVSGRLPVELADIVAEHTILAEGLPSHKTVWQYSNASDPVSSTFKRTTGIALLRSRYKCLHTAK